MEINKIKHLILNIETYRLLKSYVKKHVPQMTRDDVYLQALK